MATDQTLDQLNDYYRLNLAHLKWSFGSSLLGLFVGLGAIIAGVGLVLSGRTELASQLSIIGGVIVQFISAGFFALHCKNLKQLNVFYEKLIKHKDTLYAMSLANQMPEQERHEAQMAVIGALLSRGDPPIPAEILAAVAKK